MVSGIIDTHAAIWYTFKDPLLSPAAKAFLDAADAAQDQVGIAAITLAEIVYLIDKRKIPLDTLTKLGRLLDPPNSLLTIIPFDRPIAETMLRIDRAQVPDMPDRIIAATALYLGVPLLSKDAKIRATNLATIW